MAGGTEFNRGKFKELVLYLSQRAAETADEGFGMVKLNKLLYRADFEAFRLLGRSITGETYERQAYGPVARDLPIVLDELARAGHVIWQHPERGGYRRDVPAAQILSDTWQFTEKELDIVEATIDELAERGGKSVSVWSHQTSVGWNEVEEDGREIPYHSAFFSMDKIPDEDIERARKLGLERNWAAIRP